MSHLQAVTLSDMRCETSKDVTLSKLLTQIQTGKWSRGTDLEPYSRIKDELSIFEGVILRGNRIVVPQSLRKQILSLAHETHQGIVKTKQFLRTRFFWPGMDDATEKMIKNCQACVVNQPLNKYTPLQPTPLPRGPWVKGAVQFISEEFEAFLKSCGIRHIRVSPYYARSNGKLERFHRYLKRKISGGHL